MKILPYRGKFPEIDESVFIAEGAVVIGDVVIGRDSNIWFNAVIRGDVNYIRIGERTNIQDGCILHVTTEKYPLIVGNDVTVGHGAILHGAIIRDKCLIGMGAVVLDRAEVQSYSLVAAGSLVRQGFVVPEGTLVAGVPAKVVRELTEEEKKAIEESAIHYVELSREYKNLKGVSYEIKNLGL
jgi:carbonic anhydrase/acetyltransferase-like protein (isoleucine patch superfamily)